MVRRVNAPDAEPEESNFKIPSEKEHLLQIVDFWVDDKDPNIIVAKIEVVGGDENGLSLLQRVNIDDTLKSFYYTRMFLKSIGEPYKGSFDINEANWAGRQMYATVKHSKSKNGSKTYANIDQYNFDKRVEQVATPMSGAKPTMTAEERQKKIDANEIAWDE